jgi:hypothetical protein
LRDCAEHTGRDGQIVERLLRRIQFIANFGERAEIGVISVNISQWFNQPLESFLIKGAVMLQAILGASTKLVERPTRFGYR